MPHIATEPTGRDRSPTAVQLDNLIRRSLRISNPANPAEVAQGLRRYYPQDDMALEREAQGLPVIPEVRHVRPATTPGPSGVELEQAQADVERDLQFLTTSAQLKDVEAELLGWAQAIRSHVSDGLANAGQGLDPYARDRTFAARRALGDYARMARLVGALTPGFSLPYRRLAQSLDQVAALQLVLAGESLAQLGAGGGRFLLAAPASELVARRDAALAALRNLIGSSQVSLDQSTWPWGLRGYRELMSRLGQSGMSDVRALFEENTLARMMDELIDRAASTRSQGLRALAATGQMATQRLERLVQVAARINVTPSSPPVAGFLEAVQLFLDAFQGGAAIRLVAIARPPIVSYGLYGLGGPDVPTQRLNAIITARGELAQALDCWLACDCCGDQVICLALLDKLLYDTDRAIDLYALGSSTLGRSEPEVRAAAFGHLIRTMIGNVAQVGARPDIPRLPTIDCQQSCLIAWPALSAILERLAAAMLGPFFPPVGTAPPATAEEIGWIREELCLQRQLDQRFGDLLATLTPGCTETSRVLGALGWLVDRTLIDVEGALAACMPARVRIPPTLEDSLDTTI
ncbi:hypothetical protein [Geminicoccus roseus]|uniref:hypothetical protein n=1 Tax=Geminicoccus roseus TaxID=404900 RepID=UPI000404B206|nr:hypothetical protein [Geminicoccus roseus]